MVNTTVPPVNTYPTQEQVIVISVAGACGGMLLLTLIIITYSVVCSKRRRGPLPRFTSQVSVARSDFWPFSAGPESPPPILRSPSNTKRHVSFIDEMEPQQARRGSHQASRGPRTLPHRSRARSVGSMEPDVTGLTSQRRHRASSDSDVMTSLYTPYYVNFLDPTGSLLHQPIVRHDLSVAHFNRHALRNGHDPFLWKPGSWAAPH